VLARIRRELARHRRAKRVRAVVVEVPLLFEVGADRLVDVTVVVTASPGVQRRRLIAKHGWSEREVRSRIRAQWDLAAKVALADYVVHNDRRVQDTRRQVESLWQTLAGK
jgi:dephospho-CoA kinase